MRIVPISSLAILLLVSSAQARLLEFDANQMVTASHTYAENDRPRIAFGSDGTSHLIWAAGTQGDEDLLYAAASAGGPFGAVTLLSPGGGGVASGGGSGPTLRASGSLLAAGWEDRANPKGIWVNRSSDAGGTWELARRADTGGTDPRSFQAVGLFPNGRLAHSWMAFDAGWTNPRYDWTGEDLGGAFLPPITATAVTQGEACNCCYNDQIVLDDGQTVLLAFRNNDNNLREIHVVRSTDAGASFPEDHGIDTSGWVIPGCPVTGPHLAAAGNDIMATWHSKIGDLPHIMTARSLDGGENWDAMQIVDDFGGSLYLNYPQATVRGSKVVIVWEGTGSDGRPGIFASASVDGGLTWDASVRVTDNVGSDDMRQPTIDFAPDGELRVAWRDSRVGAERIFDAIGRFACDLELSLSNYPATVAPGGNVAFTAAASNDCDGTLSFDQAELRITGPVPLTLPIYSGPPVNIPPAGQLSSPLNVGVPISAPLGSYTATLVLLRSGAPVSGDAFECRVE